MDKENKRRAFLKYLLSLMAFSAGSILSYKGNRGLMIEKPGSINIGPSEALGMGSAGKRMKKIGVEEHITGVQASDIEKRLKDMDEARVDMHVLSYPGGGGRGADTAEIIASCKNLNENLSKIMEKYPNRFAGFATLPWQDPDAAAKELERAVKKLGLKGTMLQQAESDGSFFDEQKYWVLYETAEKLDVPVYIHPGAMPPDMSKYYDYYPVVAGAMWGFAASAGLHAVRLIVSGVFDKYPGLKIMLGHMGEGIPYWLWRMDNMYVKYKTILDKDAPGQNLKKKPSQYVMENFYVTTSGMFWHPVLQFVISVLGADRILFATDYPPESHVEAAQFIESAPISDSDMEKICHLNAERLFKL